MEAGSRQTSVGDLLKATVPPGAKKAILKIQDMLGKVSFEFKLKCAPPVLIFQMGKVGSTSIHRSLLRAYPGVVLHTHRFSPQHKNWRIRRLYRWGIFRKKAIHVISLTREPVGRNVSAFFQNFRRDTGLSYENANFSIDELKALFLSRYKHEIPLGWFDKNIKGTFGLDVFSTPFPESGFATYSRGNIRLLVIKSEIDDAEKVNALKAFLGLKQFQMLRGNIGDEKPYAETYKEFKKKVKLPPDYLSRMCESRYCRHFYDSAAIDAVKKRWSMHEEPSLLGDD